MANEIKVSLLLDGRAETLKKIDGDIKSLEKSFFKLSASSAEQMANSLKKIKDQQAKQQEEQLSKLKKQQEQEEKLKAASLARSKKTEESQINALQKKYQDYNTDKVKSLQSAMNRELAIAGNNEKLKFAIRESYGQKIGELEKQIADKQKQVQSAAQGTSIFDKKLSDITVGTGLVGIGLGKVASIATDTFKQAVSEAANFEKSIIGLNSVAKNMGEDTGRLQKEILDLTKDGLVPAGEAAAALKNLMASGLSLNQSISLFKSLKDSAAFNRQGFLSMGEAIVGATQGIKNQNSIMIDNAGITKNLSILWKEYAASIGKSVSELTDAEKAQAAFVGISKEALVFQGDAEKLTKTYSGTIDGLDAAYKKLLISGGQLVTQNGFLQQTLEGLAKNLNDLATPTDNSREGRITYLRKEIELLQKSGSSAYGTIADFQRILAQLEKEQASSEASRKSLIGNDQTDELLQNGKNRERLAIITKKINDQEAVLETARIEKQKKQQEELYDSLLKKYQDFSVDKAKEFKNSEARELSIAGDNERLKLAIKENYSQKIFELEKGRADKIADLQKAQSEYEEKIEKNRVRQLENREKVVGEFFNNPFSSTERQRDQSQEDFDRAKKIGQVGGIASAVLGGKEGARGLISGGAAAAASAMFGKEVGQVVGPLVSALSQGPDQVRAMVTEFVDSVPDLIQAIIESIPVVIEVLSEKAPLIIERLAEKAPLIIESLVRQAPKIIAAQITMMPKVANALIKEMPNIAMEFMTSLVADAPRFVTELIKSLSGSLGGIFGGKSGGGGGGGGGFLSDAYNEAKEFIEDLLPFANGGIMSAKGAIPMKAYSTGGIANKPQLALFGEGRMNEAFVPLPDGKSIPVTMKGGDSSGSNEMIAGLLTEVIRLLRNPTTVTSRLNINNRAFGEIILELNRSNQRLA